MRFWVAAAVLAVAAFMLVHALTMSVSVQTALGQVEHADLVNLRMILACAGALLSAAAGFVMAEARRTIVNNTVSRKSYDTEMPSSSWSGGESLLANDDAGACIEPDDDAGKRASVHHTHDAHD